MKRLFFCLVAIMISTNVYARDLGQWEGTDPVVKKWFEELKMPDNPSVSCCGESDAYWCDKINVREGKTYCTITDDRDDAKLKRIHIPVGTEILIPDHKLTWKDGNPTGHVIVFVNPSVKIDGNGNETITDFTVYCFVQGAGG